MLTMTLFRQFARARLLDVLGSFSTVSSGVHILNGHVLDYGSEDKFYRLLRSLSRSCELVSLEQAVSIIREDKILPRNRYVAFSFDDGYEECFTKIAPILSDFNVTAGYFINPSMIEADTSEFFRTRAPLITPRRFMSARMIKTLAEQGNVIGAHTMTHARLVGLKAEEIEREVVKCKDAIEKITDLPCSYFAWTYGKYSDIDSLALSFALDVYKYVFSSDNYSDYANIQPDGRYVFNRRHFECNWPSRHVRYFLSKNRNSVFS